MKVKLISKQNPMKREESKFYANPVNIGRKSLSSLATDMAGRSSLTRGDIENVLSNFVDLLPGLLADGFSVQLGRLGTMRLTLSSEGAEKPEKFHTDSIKPKVVFTPSVEMKESMNSISYTVEREAK